MPETIPKPKLTVQVGGMLTHMPAWPQDGCRGMALAALVQRSLGRVGRSLQDQISTGRPVLPSFFQDKSQEQQMNLSRWQVWDKLKEMTLYGIVLKVWISLVQHLQCTNTAWFWRTMRKFNGQ